MTNHFDAYSQRQGVGWLAMVRYSHKGDAWPIEEYGRPKLFPSPEAAELAAHRRLTEHMNGTMRTERDEARERAEAEWRRVAPALVRQSKTKRLVAVERK